MSEANIKLSFMTWVTPTWNIDQIIAGARKYGYQGVEIRVESKQAHGIERTASADDVKNAGLRFREAGVEVCALATSCHFALREKAEREEQIGDLISYIDLANALGCSRIRVFGGEMPDGVEPAGVVDWVADALSEVLDVAEQKHTYILLETHDSFAHTQYIREVMRQVYSEYSGVVWDIMHPLRHLEDLEESFDNIAPYVRHCHVHDCAYDADRTVLDFVPPGEGFVPNGQAVKLLAKNGFNGYLSVEVMKGDPDDVLASYAEVFKGYIEAAK